MIEGDAEIAIEEQMVSRLEGFEEPNHTETADSINDGKLSNI